MNISLTQQTELKRQQMNPLVTKEHRRSSYTNLYVKDEIKK